MDTLARNSFKEGWHMYLSACVQLTKKTLQVSLKSYTDSAQQTTGKACFHSQTESFVTEG